MSIKKINFNDDLFLVNSHWALYKNKSAIKKAANDRAEPYGIYTEKLFSTTKLKNIYSLPVLLEGKYENAIFIVPIYKRNLHKDEIIEIKDKNKNGSELTTDMEGEVSEEKIIMPSHFEDDEVIGYWVGMYDENGKFILGSDKIILSFDDLEEFIFDADFVDDKTKIVTFNGGEELSNIKKYAEKEELPLEIFDIKTISKKEKAKSKVQIIDKIKVLKKVIIWLSLISIAIFAYTNYFLKDSKYLSAIKQQARKIDKEDAKLPPIGEKYLNKEYVISEVGKDLFNFIKTESIDKDKLITKFLGISDKMPRFLFEWQCDTIVYKDKKIYLKYIKNDSNISVDFDSFVRRVNREIRKNIDEKFRTIISADNKKVTIVFDIKPPMIKDNTIGIINKEEEKATEQHIKEAKNLRNEMLEIKNKLKRIAKRTKYASWIEKKEIMNNDLKNLYIKSKLLLKRYNKLKDEYEKVIKKTVFLPKYNINEDVYFPQNSLRKISKMQQNTPELMWEGAPFRLERTLPLRKVFLPFQKEKSDINSITIPNVIELFASSVKPKKFIMNRDSFLTAIDKINYSFTQIKSMAFDRASNDWKINFYIDLYNKNWKDQIEIKRDN